MSDFLLPDLGEGLTEATIVAWHVAVGDEVIRNQAIAEVETAKALVELPSPRAGRITVLHAAEGETLDVGAPLIGFEDAEAPADHAPVSGADSAADSAATDPTATEPSTVEAPAEEPRPQRQQVLVGYGPVMPGSGRPRRRPRTFPTTPYERPAHAGEDGPTPRAMPPVRRRARDLGVDLRTVHGSGPGGRILRADVEARAHGGTCCGAATPGAAPRGAAAPAAGAAPAGTATGTGSHTIPVTGLRKQTAQAMTDSAFTAPHASVHVTIDVTDTLELLRRGGRDGRRTSFLAAVCRALVPAVGRTPAANARFDAEARQIEVFDEVRLGIAVATERGLLVATLPAGSAEDGPGLTAAIADTAGKAREGALSPAELTGSTLTVTNVGVFGVHGGTPILNPGQSTILALGALRTQPWEHRGEVALRTVVTLTLSFDHRVLDGAEASAFLMDIAETLAEPASLLVR